VRKLIACMRKVLTILNAMVRENVPFNTYRVTASQITRALSRRPPRMHERNEGFHGRSTGATCWAVAFPLLGWCRTRMDELAASKILEFLRSGLPP
jgi:hypothetical protein